MLFRSTVSGSRHRSGRDRAADAVSGGIVIVDRSSEHLMHIAPGSIVVHIDVLDTLPGATAVFLPNVLDGPPRPAVVDVGVSHDRRSVLIPNVAVIATGRSGS